MNREPMVSQVSPVPMENPAAPGQLAPPAKRDRLAKWVSPARKDFRDSTDRPDRWERLANREKLDLQGKWGRSDLLVNPARKV